MTLRSCEGVKESHVSERKVPFNPKCSVWGLVCVLLLMEGTRTAKDLFGDCNNPPSLATETLQVCVTIAYCLVRVVSKCHSVWKLSHMCHVAIATLDTTTTLTGSE